MTRRWWISLAATWIAAAAVAAEELGPEIPAPAAPGSPLELIDVVNLPRLRPHRTFQASGYDRGGGFYDSGNFPRIEADGTWVLLEATGPGAIRRIWTTTKRDLGLDIRFEVDGREWLRADRESLFPAAGAPAAAPGFAPPLAGRSTPLACHAYVPIPWRESCRITMRPRGPLEERDFRTSSGGERIPHVYWQIGWSRFPAGSSLAGIDAPSRAAELRAAAEVWRRYAPGGEGDAEDPGPPPGCGEGSRVEGAARVEDGAARELLRLEGPGMLTRIRLRVPGLDLDGRARVSIRIRVDGEETPGVDVPVDAFFAVGQNDLPVRGLLAGGHGDSFYSHLPAPYAKELRLEVANGSGAARDVSWSAVSRKLRDVPDDFAFLRARAYSFRDAPRGEDLVLLETDGRGHLVGCVMVDVGNMEGDERISVDGGPVSEWHGTGTEDFLNFAWGLGHRASFPLHGLGARSTATGRHANGYRFLLTDAVPFARSLRFTIEHGHGNEDPGAYRGAVFYYLRTDR